MTLNIFDDLFEFKPGGDQTPRENFLTQAWAHILRRYPQLARGWIERIVGAEIQGSPTIMTQRRYVLNEKISVVDMLLRFRLSAGGSGVVISEHKWDSVLSNGQLRRYRLLLNEHSDFDGASERKLLFICNTSAQQAAATADCDLALQWNDLSDFLEGQVNLPPLAREFQAFLHRQALGHRLFTAPLLKKNADAGEVRAVCSSMGQRLALQPWDCLPKKLRVDKQPIAHFERIGVAFRAHSWKPYVFAGIQRPSDALWFGPCMPAQPLDLVFLIGVDRPARAIQGKAVTYALKRVREVLPQTQAIGPLDTEVQDKHLKLVVRESLATVLQGKTTPDAQRDAIYARFEQWCDLLFSGSLLRAIRKTFPTI